VKKKKSKETKTYLLKEIRKLKKKCLKLWSENVRWRSGYRCAFCGSTEYLHSHHIEDVRLCPALRYEPRNGICLCARHHKFGRGSAHKSFIAMYTYMTTKRVSDLTYLLEHRNDKVLEYEYGAQSTIAQLNILKEYLVTKIGELRNEWERR